MFEEKDNLKTRKPNVMSAVVTWGYKGNGGDSSSVQASLRGVDKIYSTHSAFAALLQDGTVVHWGNRNYGG